MVVGGIDAPGRYQYYFLRETITTATSAAVVDPGKRIPLLFATCRSLPVDFPLFATYTD